MKPVGIDPGSLAAAADAAAKAVMSLWWVREAIDGREGSLRSKEAAVREAIKHQLKREIGGAIQPRVCKCVGADKPGVPVYGCKRCNGCGFTWESSLADACFHCGGTGTITRTAETQSGARREEYIGCGICLGTGVGPD